MGWVHGIFTLATRLGEEIRNALTHDTSGMPIATTTNSPETPETTPLPGQLTPTQLQRLEKQLITANRKFFTPVAGDKQTRRDTKRRYTTKRERKDRENPCDKQWRLRQYLTPNNKVPGYQSEREKYWKEWDKCEKEHLNLNIQDFEGPAAEKKREECNQLKKEATKNVNTDLGIVARTCKKRV